MRSNGWVVFVGPSAPAADRPVSSRIQWRPPIRRGDLASLPPTVRGVGIVDGEFDQSLAVSPREILSLLARGVEVVGSSSMGALRAAELHEQGMRGVGRIFEMYRDEEVVADDEVALLFDPGSLRPLTEPLVNVRCAVKMAEAASLLSCREAGAIIEAGQALPYQARTYRRILADAGRLVGKSLVGLEAAFVGHDQKRLDAARLFREIVVRDDRDLA